MLCSTYCGCSEGYETYYPIAESQWPIVYSPEYNIRFGGLENLHPFDSKKWERVYDILEGMCLLIWKLFVEIVLSLRC